MNSSSPPVFRRKFTSPPASARVKIAVSAGSLGETAELALGRARTAGVSPSPGALDRNFQGARGRLRRNFRRPTRYQVNQVNLSPLVSPMIPRRGRRGLTPLAPGNGARPPALFPSESAFFERSQAELKSRGDAKISSEATHSSKSRNFGEGSPDFNEVKCEKNVRLSEETMRRPRGRAAWRLVREVVG